MTTEDSDDRHARDFIVPLSFNDNTDLHCLIRKRLILPTFAFHPSFIEEYAGGLLMDLQKQVVAFALSCAGRSGVAASPVSP